MTHLVANRRSDEKEPSVFDELSAPVHSVKVETARFTNNEEGKCPVCRQKNATEHMADEMKLGEVHIMVPAEANGIDVLVCLEHNCVSPIPNEGPTSVRV